MGSLLNCLPLVTVLSASQLQPPLQRQQQCRQQPQFLEVQAVRVWVCLHRQVGCTTTLLVTRQW